MMRRGLRMIRTRLKSHPVCGFTFGLEKDAIGKMFTWCIEVYHLWSRILKSRDLLGEFGKSLPDGSVMEHYSNKVIKQFLGG